MPFILHTTAIIVFLIVYLKVNVSLFKQLKVLTKRKKENKDSVEIELRLQLKLIVLVATLVLIVLLQIISVIVEYNIAVDMMVLLIMSLLLIAGHSVSSLVDTLIKNKYGKETKIESQESQEKLGLDTELGVKQ